MTTDILKMAKASYGPITGQWWDMDVAALKRFYDLACADQREKDAALCGKIADDETYGHMWADGAGECEKAIKGAK